MSAVAEAPVSTLPVRIDSPSAEQHLLLHNVSWESYVAIGNALPDWPALSMTYDCGSLEFMTHSSEHEIYKTWIAKLIDTIAEELGLPAVTAGQMTFQREDLRKGIEGDACYWIAHEPQVRGKLHLDPTADPPPDLMLEIEVSRSALSRMGIYAALHIPEVWCFDGGSLRVYHLQPDGKYQLGDRSLAFPTVPLEGLAPYFLPSETIDYLSMKRAFRAWLRSLAPQ